MDSDIMTVKEVAAYLKIAEKTAYRLTAEGKIPGFKVGGAWRYRRAEIDAWIESQEYEVEDIIFGVTERECKADVDLAKPNVPEQPDTATQPGNDQ